MKNQKNYKKENVEKEENEEGGGFGKEKLRIMKGSSIRMKFRGRFARILEEREAEGAEEQKTSRNSEDNKKEVDKKDERKTRILTKYLEKVLSVIRVEVMVSSIALRSPIGAPCALLDSSDGGVARQAEIPLICAAHMNVYGELYTLSVTC